MKDGESGPGAGAAAGPGLSVRLGRAVCAIHAEHGAVCEWAPSGSPEVNRS